MVYSVPDRMAGRTSAAGDGAAGDLSRRDGQLQTRSSTSPFAMRADTGEYGRNGDWRMETASISDAGCEGTRAAQSQLDKERSGWEAATGLG
jgi:hypothetical protein